jgi:hypothetical protein
VGLIVYLHRRRPRSKSTGKCSNERLTRATAISTMRRAARPSGRARCGAGAGCSAIKHQSLSTLQHWYTSAQSTRSVLSMRASDPKPYILEQVAIVDARHQIGVSMRASVPGATPVLMGGNAKSPLPCRPPSTYGGLLSAAEACTIGRPPKNANLHDKAGAGHSCSSSISAVVCKCRSGSVEWGL